MAIDVRPILELDEEIRSKIIKTSYVPQQSTSVVRASSPSKETTLYTDFFKRNQPITTINNTAKAVVKSNQYTAGNPKKTDIVSALLERTAKNAKFIKDNPKFALDQAVLHLLNVNERQVWNPLGIIGATVPFVGGGNIPDAISVDKLIGTEKYLKARDRLKKKYDDVYAGLFGSNDKTLAGQNTYDPSNQYTKDSPTFNIEGNNVLINYRQLYDSKKDDSSILGSKGSKLDADGNVIITHNIDTYFDDIEKDASSKFGDKYIAQTYTPESTAADFFKNAYQETYDNLTQIFYAESNIKVNFDKNENKKQFTSDRKIMYFYCGLEDGIADNISASWSPGSFIGSSESIYTYDSAKRSTTLSLIMYADIKDAQDIPIGQVVPVSDLTSYKNKIEWLMQHCYPSYHTGDTGVPNQLFKAPIIYLTLGNLFVSQPCIIDSVSVSYHDTWEIDPGSIIPIVANVELGLTIIHKTSPTNDTLFLTGQ